MARLHDDKPVKLPTSKLSAPIVTALIAGLMLVIGATAGSLTPPGAVSSTMHSLANIYDSIASATFDSSGIVADQNGSLMGNLKYIENQLGWASASNNLYYLGTGNVGIGDSTPEASFEVAGTASLSVLFAGNASISNSLEVSNVASVSNLYVSGNTTINQLSVSQTPTLTLEGFVSGGGLANARDVEVSGRYAYVVTDADYLTVVDISRPSAPAILGSVGGAGNSMDACTGVDVAGQYAYAVCSGSDAFVVIDVSNPSAPVRVGALTGTSNFLDFAYDVQVVGRYAYVVSGVSTAGITVIDVSNPRSPTYVGRYAYSGGDTPQRMSVQGNRLYVASTNYVSVFDLSNPALPVLIGRTGDSFLVNIAVSGRYAYVVSSFTTSLKVIDISNPASPSHVGSVTDGTLLASAIGMSAIDGYAFVSTQAGRLVAVDVRNPAAPIIVGSISGIPNATEMTVAGKYAYVSSFTGSGLYIVDLGGIQTPTLNAGSMFGGSMFLNNDADIGAQLNVRGGATIGAGGLQVQGFSAFSSASYFGGNVGVGTSSPVSRLTILRGPRLGGYISGSGLTPAALSAVWTLDSASAITGAVIQGVWDRPAGGGGMSNLIVAAQVASSSSQNLTTGSLISLTGVAEHLGTGSVISMRGMYGIASNRSSGNVTTGIGVYGAIGSFGAGTYTAAYGVLARPDSITAGTVQSAYNLYSGRVDTFSGGALTSHAGLAIEHLTQATNNTAILIASASSALNIPAGNFGIWNGSPYNNYFAGNVGIAATAPASPFSLGRNAPVVQGFVSATAPKLFSASSRLTTVGDVGGVFQSVWDLPAGGNGTIGFQAYAQTASNSSQNMTGHMVALYGIAEHMGTGTANMLSGVRGFADNRSSALLSVARAVTAVTGSTGTGAVGTARGFQFDGLSISGGGTVSSSYGFYSSRASFISGAVTRQAGFAVEHLTEAGQANVALLIASASSGLNIPAGNFGIWNGSPYVSYFAGNVGIGTTSPAAKLQVVGNASVSANFEVYNTTGTASFELFSNNVPDKRFILQSATNGFDVNDSAANDRLTFRNNVGAELMSIASSGILSVNGDYSRSQPAAIQLFTDPNLNQRAYITSYGITGEGVEGKISFATGANPIFEIYGGENNTFQLTTDSSFEFRLAGANTLLFSIDALGNGAFTGNASVSGGLEIRGLASLSVTFVDLTGTQTTHAVCHPSAGTGVHEQLVDCDPTAGADFMEMYPVAPDVQEGMIVVPSTTDFVTAADGNKVPRLIRSTIPYQDSILGITSVASQAGDFNSIGHNLPLSENPKPLALSGRVLLQIKGPIAVGDRVTSSDTPGIGMKATKSGMTVGIALQSTDTDGSILVFVQPQYWAPEMPTLPDAPQPDGLFATIIGWFKSILGIEFGQGSVKTDKVESRELCVGGRCITEEEFIKVFGTATPEPTAVTEPTSVPAPTASSSAETLQPTPAGTAPGNSSDAQLPEATASPTPDAAPLDVSPEIIASGSVQ